MAPHAPQLTADELADIRRWTSEQHAPKEIWKLHRTDRRQRRVRPLCLTALRKAVRGVSYRGGEERRGSKRKLGQRAIQALNVKRRALVDQCKGGREVSWPEVIKKARVKKVHPTTAKRSLRDAGIPVASRTNREKPQRKPEHVTERFEKCGRWRFLPTNYWGEVH